MLYAINCTVDQPYPEIIRIIWSFFYAIIRRERLKGEVYTRNKCNKYSQVLFTQTIRDILTKGNDICLLRSIHQRYKS